MQLSELALDRFNRAAPELTKYIKAFKDMSDDISDDVGIQLGVFVLAKSGNQFFVPVISKSGTIYPIDIIYFAEERCFFPLTKKTIEQILSSSNTSFGSAARTPQTAIKNPDINDLIVPPKTGKFMYATSSRLVEFVALLPDHLKERLADALEDEDVILSSRDLMDMRSIISLLKERQRVETKISAELPQVITDGVDLPEDIVRDIMVNGYHVANAPETGVTVVTMESSGANTYTHVDMTNAGKAYTFIGKYGEGMELAVLPMLRKPSRPAESYSKDAEKRPSYGNVECCSEDSGSLRNNHQVLMGAGGVVHYFDVDDIARRPVALQQEVDYASIIDSCPSYPITQLIDFVMDCPYLVLTPRGFAGPFNIAPKYVNGHIILGDNMVFHDSYPAGGYWNDGTWMFNTGCTFIPVHQQRGGNYRNFRDTFCFDINVAQMRHEMKMSELLPYRSTLTAVSQYGNPDSYVLNGEALEKEASLMDALVVKGGMSLKDAQMLAKQASDMKGRTLQLMTSAPLQQHEKSAADRASESVRRTPIAEYGEKLPPSESGTGTRADRERARNMDTAGTRSKVKDAIKTRDSQVIESTIMSEILQDQDMIETTAEYLPDIKSAVDKLGRVLLLARIHSAKLSDDYDSEGLSDLITSIRNSFRSLGENYIRLEQMSRNV